MTETLSRSVGSEDSDCFPSLRYEQLREQWLRRNGGHKNGLALFLNSGMTAWAAKWVACIEPLKRQSPSLENQSRVSGDAVEPKPVIEGGLIPEVTRLLATMTLRATEGAWLKA